MILRDLDFPTVPQHNALPLEYRGIFITIEVTIKENDDS